jgi:integrase
MARPRRPAIRVHGLTDLSKRPSVRVRKARTDDNKRKNWLVRWTINGRGHQKSFRYKREAKTFIEDLERAISRQESFNETSGFPISWETENPTYSEWARQYILENASTWASRTLRSNTESIARGVVLLRRSGAPDVDAATMKSLREWLRGEADECPTSIARWSLKLSDCTKRVCASARTRIQQKEDGSALKATVATRHRIQVGATFAEALDRELIEHNHWKTNRRSQKQARKARIAPKTREDIPSMSAALELIDKVGNPHHQILLLIILLAGLRPSEARGLRIEDLELPRSGWGTIHVRRSLTSANADEDDSEHLVKTGQRAVPAPPDLVQALKKHVGKRDSGLLATAARLGPVPEGNLPEAWRNVCTNTNWVPYSLRHTAATTWFDAGVNPAEIARRLGNSVETLLKVYVNLIEGMDDSANERIETALKKSAKKPVKR